MNWLQRYRIRHYIRNSIVVLPVLGIVAAVVTVWVLHSIEKQMGWESPLSPEAARMVIGTLAAAIIKETSKRKKNPLAGVRKGKSKKL